MKLSARNQLKGKILKVDEGLITSKLNVMYRLKRTE